MKLKKLGSYNYKYKNTKTNTFSRNRWDKYNDHDHSKKI